jgi:ABC-type molybdenum transport system ATPase subunit/photorepair protein PhrA
MLQNVQDYLCGESDEPLVIHGPSGCGKTSLLAMATKQAWEWFDGHVAVIIRCGIYIIME